MRAGHCAAACSRRPMPGSSIPGAAWRAIGAACTGSASAAGLDGYRERPLAETFGADRPAAKAVPI